MENEKPKDFSEEKELKTQPGREHEMVIKPDFFREKQNRKLADKVAVITGGDSGIGRAAAVLFAQEGAKIVIVYLDEDKDAKETSKILDEIGAENIIIKGDAGEEKFCQEVVRQTLEKFGQIDVLVNNAAEQHPVDSLTDITEEQLVKTFRTNIFAYFFLTKAALPHLKKGASIINTTSVTAYRGSPQLIDYSSTKGAIVAFTRSLSGNLAKEGIRVNAVAPGPVWTPLIPSTFPPEKVEKFGQDTPMGRAGQPEEIAPCFLFLASEDASYITGQVLHPNGGDLING